MSTIIGNLQSTVLILLYISVGLVNGQDNLPSLMRQTGHEYVGGVAPCLIIRNTYDNHKDEMKNFRNIQQKCGSRPRIVGFNEACTFLMKLIFEAEDIPDESEYYTKQRFVRRVYYALSNAVGDTPLGELSHIHVVDGLMTVAQSDKTGEAATAVCQHWATLADLYRGDNDRYKFGSSEVTSRGYTPEKMEKVYASCQALGLRSALGPKSVQASSSDQPG